MDVTNELSTLVPSSETVVSKFLTMLLLYGLMEKMLDIMTNDLPGPCAAYVGISVPTTFRPLASPGLSLSSDL